MADFKYPFSRVPSIVRPCMEGIVYQIPFDNGYSASMEADSAVKVVSKSTRLEENK